MGRWRGECGWRISDHDVVAWDEKMESDIMTKKKHGKDGCLALPCLALADAYEGVSGLDYLFRSC